MEAGDKYMNMSCFRAYYKAKELANYAFGDKKFIPVFASSDIEIYPYQIAAARFAMRSPYLKGAILCDEGSLGKTYEAMLVITQMWYENRKNILIIVTTPLLNQWIDIIENKFSMPYYCIDNNLVFNEYLKDGNENPFLQDGIIITTYDFAQEKYDYIEKVKWDLTVFEEAHHLRRVYAAENKGAKLIQNAVKESYKLLLTATPMQNSIMDLYGLIHFIDESALQDEKTFYQRYFRKPENYSELADRVSKYCFRATRPQVSTYVKIPERIPITVDFELTSEEQKLYDFLELYIQKDQKIAFPKMDKYDLALMLFRTFSSSTFALERTLYGVVKRLEKMFKDDPLNKKLQDELTQVKDIYKLAKSITQNAKGCELLKSLRTGFSKLKSLGANKKALIFTENRATQKYIYKLLNENGYKDKVLLFNGNYSRDYSIMQRFKKEAEILVATDIAAEGFNLEFCSFVINYDLPYNTLTIEQRINRCHRQGQLCDVIILNFLNKNNFADVRILELINKRVLQFRGIFGMSDDLIGNFGLDFSDVIAKARTKKEIDAAFNEVLEEYEEANKRIIETAEYSLFTSFSKDIANKVTITPQYIENKIKEINEDLWYITKYFFESKAAFHIDEETRTISCFGTPPKVFTGTAMRRNEYSMDKSYQPRSGRHTITGSLAKNILKEISWVGVPDKGEVIVDGDIESCTIGYYKVNVKSKGDFMGGTNFYTFVGKTKSGRILDDKECKKIMDLPIAKCMKYGDTHGERDGPANEQEYHSLDDLVSADEFIQKAIVQNSDAEREEIERLKQYAEYQKAELYKNIDSIKREISLSNKRINEMTIMLEKIKAEKQTNSLKNELKRAEQNLFFEKMRIEQECKEKIQDLIDKSEIGAKITREFLIQIRSGM